MDRKAVAFALTFAVIAYPVYKFSHQLRAARRREHLRETHLSKMMAVRPNVPGHPVPFKVRVGDGFNLWRSIPVGYTWVYIVRMRDNTQWALSYPNKPTVPSGGTVVTERMLVSGSPASNTPEDWRRVSLPRN